MRRPAVRDTRSVGNGALSQGDAAAVLDVIGTVAEARTVDDCADIAMKGSLPKW